MNIKETSFKIIVKPNSPKNEVVGYDESREAYRVNIKAKAEDNKANIETMKFLSKLIKKRVKVVSGLKSKEKTIRLEQTKPKQTEIKFLSFVFATQNQSFINKYSRYL